MTARGNHQGQWSGRRIAFERPNCRPGDYVELRAEMDCVLVFSACPDDVYPTNGGDGTPRDAHVGILDDAGARTQ